MASRQVQKLNHRIWSQQTLRDAALHAVIACRNQSWFLPEFHGICSSWTLPTVGPWKNPPMIEFLASMGLGGSSFSSFSPGAPGWKMTEFPRRSQVNHQISRRCWRCTESSYHVHILHQVDIVAIICNNVNKRSWNVVPPLPRTWKQVLRHIDLAQVPCSNVSGAQPNCTSLLQYTEVLKNCEYM